VVATKEFICDKRRVTQIQTYKKHPVFAKHSMAQGLDFEKFCLLLERKFLHFPSYLELNFVYAVEMQVIYLCNNYASYM
jgi:hypothetical protein